MESLILPDGVHVHWDSRTGRGFRTPSDPRAVELRKRQLQVGEPLADWVPQRSRHVLTLPDRVWGVRPLVHSHGGFAYGALPVNRSLWESINGSRSLAAIASDLDCSLEEVLERMGPLTAIDTQAVQLWPQRVTAHRLRHLLAPSRPAHPRSDDQLTNNATSLGAYHHEITDAVQQFDERETTVAHVLADPHPALHGEPFGKALRQALMKRGFDTTHVVEVGCGTGELAAAWGEATYLRIDRSPGLLRDQQAAAPATVGVLGDAVALPLRDESVRCLISNEVLADLPSGRTSTGWDNLGARAFVDNIARVLAPGGRAYLSEFGVLEGAAEEATQLDHPEVSIQFRLLAQHAQNQGLHTEIVLLPELLGMNLGAEQLARHSWNALRALLRAEGHEIRTRAWTRQTLQLPWRVEGLEWATMADEGPGPLVTRFYALLLTRMNSPASSMNSPAEPDAV